MNKILKKTMDCNRCRDGEATLAKISYWDGDTHSMFLCERCLNYFEADETVETINVP